MSENNNIRIMKAVKEFNIGKDTLVEFLKNKGFDVQNNPNAILSTEMYKALQLEFAADKDAKKKSDSINLPKTPAEEKAKNAALKTTPTEKIKIPTPILEAPKVVDKINLDPPTADKKTNEEKAPEKTTKTTKKKTEEETPQKIKIDAPELDGPKIVGKIDLSKKAKKETKAEEKAPEKATKSTKKKTTEKPSETPPTPPIEIPAPPPATEEEAPTIENIKVKKLEGPKIIGKINLPVAPDPRQNQQSAAQNNEKRKRKRIPVDRKPNDNSNSTAPNTSPQNNNRYQGGVQNRNNNYQQRPNYNNNNYNRNNNYKPQSPEDKIIDEKAIQDKINQTLSKLGTNTRGKSLKAKYRRNKREEIAEKQNQNSTTDGSKIQLTEFISVSELANLMNVNFTDVISKCMSLGIMVSINQRLDAEVIELVSSEFGFTVEFINLEQEAEIETDTIQDDPADLQPRPPIVTIMGHVDHGKTSLLDYIRKTKVVAGEAGGITQHIGAYEVELENGKQITFLDTPGHEAFTAMRARGAKITDIAVIVVAADDAVMPQTREAISHAQAAGVPMIFAINKIDKEGANPEKIREQLSSMNILLEEWGGKYQSQELSARSGIGIETLLEKILLEAELLDLKANPNREATGSVVEASLDKGRGFVCTLLVQSGTLQIGDMIVAGSIFGRVKAMQDERGKKVTAAGPSTPVQILGLNGAPQSGEKFKVYQDEDEAKEIATHRAQILREQGMRTRKHITLDEIGRRLALGNFKQLNLIIKGDVDGSVEALSDSLQKLSTEEVVVSVVHKAVGQITESDVLLATASDAIIVGFQVRPSIQASRIAENENIEIRTYSIIYDAIEEIRSAMEGLLEPKVERKTVCNIEVKEVFKITGIGAVAGCMVLSGKIKRENKINIVRDGIVIYNGELAALKRFKDDVKEVTAGTECGISIKNYNDIKAADIIEGYEEYEVKRTL